jgi:hypothetical protein
MVLRQNVVLVIEVVVLSLKCVVCAAEFLLKVLYLRLQDTMHV